MFVEGVEVPFAEAETRRRALCRPFMLRGAEDVLSEREEGIKERAFELDFGREHLNDRRTERRQHALPCAAGGEEFPEHDGKERKKAFGGGERDRPAEGKAFIQERRRTLDVRPKVGIGISERLMAVPLPRAKEERAPRGCFPPFPLILKEGGRLGDEKEVMRIAVFAQHLEITRVRSFPHADDVHDSLRLRIYQFSLIIHHCFLFVKGVSWRHSKGAFMLFSLLTVVFYAASSLGDKYISQRLECSAKEFSFLVSFATAFFLALLLPFLGWDFAFSWRSVIILLLLIACKIGEFYTSASLLKTVSAYELKAWLCLNVIVSYLVDLGRGM